MDIISQHKIMFMTLLALTDLDSLELWCLQNQIPIPARRLTLQSLVEHVAQLTLDKVRGDTDDA